MKSKHVFLCLLMAAGLFSCSSADTESYCPTWLGFTYTVNDDPNPGNPRNAVVHPGDVLHITAHQDKRGHLINATDYSWTVYAKAVQDVDGHVVPDEIVAEVEEYRQHTNYDGYDNGADDPVGHLTIPETMKEGSYYVKFVARYVYSGQGVTIDYENFTNDSYGGHIIPQSGPSAGGAVGEFNFKVVKVESN